MRGGDGMSFKFLQIASNAYLRAPLPDSWEELTDEEQGEFLASNACEPHGDHTANELLDLIDGHAGTIEGGVG